MYDFLSTLFWAFLKISENKFGGVNTNNLHLPYNYKTMEIVNLLAEECKYYLNIEQTFWIDVIYTWRIDHDFDGSEIIAVHLRSVSIFGIDLPTWQLPKDIKNSIKQSIECRIARELLMVTP